MRSGTRRAAGGARAWGRAWGRAWAAVPVLAAAGQIAAFWPGVMVWDSLHQYAEARAGRYRDWHPPAMAWLWRQLDAVMPGSGPLSGSVSGSGPAPMLLLQVALYAAGFALLARAAARAGGVRFGWAAALCALLPAPYLLVGTVLKDSLMAGALLVAAGLAALDRPGRRWPALPAAALLLGAATLRFNAVPACLPLALMLFPAAWRRRTAGKTAALVVAALALAAAMPLANRALRAGPSGVELSLAIYDLGGIARFSGADPFPPMPVADAGGVAARCWSAVSWDSYSWWVDRPCAVDFERVRAAFAARHASAVRWWLAAIAAHPLAYARARLAHLACDWRVTDCGGRLPGLSLDSDPNPYGYRVGPGRWRAAVDAVAVASLATPLGWPVCWLALAAACLLVRPGGPGPAAPLAWSALLYGLGYAPLGVASEVRYHLWTMSAAALAAVLTLAERPEPTRSRRIAASALVVATVAAASLARLA